MSRPRCRRWAEQRSPPGPPTSSSPSSRAHPQATLRAEITPDVAFVLDGDSSDGGVPAARRLVRDLEIEPTGTRVVLTKLLSVTARVDEASLARVRRSTAAAHVADALDELRVQNTELVRTLDELTQQKEYLRRFNEELEETNRGVLAMYDQPAGWRRATS